MIELLAPAKDKICAKAAIDYGADAVYIGANDFGARKNAANSFEDIKEVVEYAHKFNVKIYAAINTILTDEEIVKAKKLIEKLEEIGVDAVIIQDMGLLPDAKTQRGKDAKPCHCEDTLNYYPPLAGGSKSLISGRGIPIHSSTQCDNRTPEKVKFLEDVGFSRVILARELSIEQIKEIRTKTNVELEAFIHGALCVSYSGQCYLSHAIGGRSANRGECAQPCRKKYSLVDRDGNFIAKDKYLLCLKDFNASKHIKDLADVGVTSFKIEGRLKDVNYVKNVVAYYRKLIDDLGFEKTSSGRILMDFEPDLEKSFNRGFTDYFLDGKRKEIYTFDSPKSRGKYIGKVSKVYKDCFELDTPFTIHHSLFTAQDGLCFFNSGELQGCLVNKCQSRLGLSAQQQVFPNKMDGIKVGTEIYRNSDVEFEKILKNSKTCRKLVVNITFDLNKISAVDEDGNSAEIEYEFDEFAQNRQKMWGNIENQLKKSGESIFLVEKVEILADKLPFLPVSKLNELRRKLLDKLLNGKGKRGKGKLPLRGTGVNGDEESRVGFSPPNQEVAYLQKNSVLDYKANILNKSAKEFYEKQRFEVAEYALESGGINPNGKVVMTCKHCLKHSFNLCKSPQKLNLIDEKGKKYELKFNCEKCEMEVVF
jgi:23S rRNA 5-hydroxycytidine C2501 synthase